MAPRAAAFVVRCCSTSATFEWMSPSLDPSSSWSFSDLCVIFSDLGPDGVPLGAELGDVLFAIADELAKLLELALRRVRFALRPRAIELLTRVIELLHHSADIGDELVACFVSRRDALQVVLPFLVQALQ